MIMERYGFKEETYYTFSYSPIPDDEGGTGGIFCANTDDTRRVIGARRLKTLRDLGERSLMEGETAEDACKAAARSLGGNPFDIPFALIYLLDDEGKSAVLCETVGVERERFSGRIELGGGRDVWDLTSVFRTTRTRKIADLEKEFGRLPAGAWADDWTREAVVAPLAKAGVQESPAGFLVAGVSPRLRFDDDYQGFLELVGGQIATAISNARAYEEEKKRAEALAELDRAKTVFFSNVSHEFRTPLTLLLGPLEETLAQSDGLPSQSRERLEIAHRNSLRLLKLVNTLLDFSRIEAGRVQAVYAPTDLGAYTAELASVFRSAIEKSGLQLIIDCPPLPDSVYVDREMWEKIVLNLLSNTFKFTFDGEISISLRQVGDMVELA